MEKLSFEFTRALGEKTRVEVIANRSGKSALWRFLPSAAVRLWALAPRADVIHFGDPALSLLIPFLPRPRKPLAVTIHGLDILYPNPWYQKFLHRFLPRADLALCISRFVEDVVLKRFPGLRTTVITPGLNASFHVPNATRPELERSLGRSVPKGPLLLAVARLVPRKGLAWFVADVLPHVSATLLIVGTGPEARGIAAAAERNGVDSRALLLGALNIDTLRLAYSVADLLVMPNVPVPGDAEGFGLVALEAASAGLPVVAAKLEGIEDAIIEEQTGYLLPPQDARAWVRMILRLLNDQGRRRNISERAPAIVRQRFSWNRRADDVLAAFARLG